MGRFGVALAGEGAGALAVRAPAEAAPPTFEWSWWIRIHSSVV
jgi:hypothetical protein